MRQRLLVVVATIAVSMVGAAGVASAHPGGGKREAAREVLAAMLSGKTVYEDYSFKGSSPNVRRWNDTLADECQGKVPVRCLVRVSKGR